MYAQILINICNKKKSLQDDAGVQVPTPAEPSLELMRQASAAALDLAKGAVNHRYV